MPFGPFKPKSPRFLAICQNAEARLEIEVTQSGPQERYKLSKVLAILIMTGAAHFTTKTLPGFKVPLKGTNLDVIVAETAIWLTFIAGKMWRADQHNDHAMFERMGFGITRNVTMLMHGIIGDATGFDIEAIGKARRFELINADKQGISHADVFTYTIVRSLGRKTPYEETSALDMLSPVVTSAGLAAMTFYASMAPALWQTFKNILREHDELFPYDEADP